MWHAMTWCDTMWRSADSVWCCLQCHTCGSCCALWRRICWAAGTSAARGPSLGLAPSLMCVCVCICVCACRADGGVLWGTRRGPSGFNTSPPPRGQIRHQESYLSSLSLSLSPSPLSLPLSVWHSCQCTAPCTYGASHRPSTKRWPAEANRWRSAPARKGLLPHPQENAWAAGKIGSWVSKFRDDCLNVAETTSAITKCSLLSSCWWLSGFSMTGQN